MSSVYRIPVRLRFILCAAMAALALLFLGAVKIQDTVQMQKSEQAETGIKCRSILADWNRAVPADERKNWDVLADRDPFILLRSLCCTTDKE